MFKLFHNHLGGFLTRIQSLDLEFQSQKPKQRQSMNEAHDQGLNK